MFRTATLRQTLQQEADPSVWEAVRRLLATPRSTADQLRERLVKLVFGSAAPLHAAKNREELETIFGLLATKELVQQWFDIVLDPNFREVNRGFVLAELSSAPPPIKNQRAAQLLEDIQERAQLLSAKLPQKSGSVPTGRVARWAIKWSMANWRGARAYAGHVVAVSALCVASYADDEPWQDWALDAVSLFGTTAIAHMAQELGVPRDHLPDVLITKRERDLAARPANEATSGRRAAELGLPT
jgi:hypothetical protein